MSELIKQDAELVDTMKVILQSRCGCSKVEQIAATEAPEFIQVNLMIPDGWPQETRRFKYVGDSQVDGSAVYMEQIDKIPEGYEFLDGKLVEVSPNSENEE